MGSKDEDFYRFTLPAAGAVTLSFSHGYVDSSSVYWTFRLYNSEYQEINEYVSKGNVIEDNSSPVGLEAGTYYVRIVPYNTYSIQTIPYRLRVGYTQSDAWETEFNDQFADADLIPVNKSVGGSIMNDSDEDFYRFELDQADTVSITFKHDYLDYSGTVWQVYLYNDAFKQISRYDSKGTDARNLFGPSNLAAGTYYVKISPYSSYTYSTNTYVFSVSAGSESSPAPSQSPTPIPTSTPTASPTSTSSPTPTPEMKFTDVDPKQYYAKPIAWAVANGVTNGTSKTTFSPNTACTRGQIVTFLWKAAGKPEPSSTQNPFVDVKTKDYYFKPVLWAVENHITSGTDKTHFSPLKSCTRGEAVTFMWRANGSPSSPNSSFSDISQNSFYKKAVDWAVATGVTSGTGGNRFSPIKTCNRGEIVTFLYRHYVEAADVNPPRPEDTAYQNIIKGLSSSGYFLYDVDGDGTRELIVLLADEAAIRGSVYTVKDGRAIGLMDNETIMSMASVPGDRIGVVSRRGEKFICTRSWNSGYSHPYTSNTGEIKLYTLSGGNLSLSEKVEYRIQSMNPIVPGETDITWTVNGSSTALDYAQYQEWIESITWLSKLEQIEGQRTEYF